MAETRGFLKDGDKGRSVQSVFNEKQFGREIA
jgi:hypothetical protein